MADQCFIDIAADAALMYVSSRGDTYIARAFCRLQEDLWISVCLSSPLLPFSPSATRDFSTRAIRGREGGH